MAGNLGFLDWLVGLGGTGGVGNIGTAPFNPSAPPVGGMGPPAAPTTAAPSGMPYKGIGPPQVAGTAPKTGLAGFSQRLGEAFNDPMMQFGMNMLAQSGPSLMPTSFGQAAGRSGLAAMQAQQQQALAKSRQDLMDAQIGRLQRGPMPVQDPAAVRTFEAFEELGNGSTPDTTKNEKSGLSPAQERFLLTRRGRGVENVPGAGLFDSTTGEEIVPESTIQGGMADRASVESEGRTRADRERKAKSEIPKLEQKIERADYFIDQLESGKLDTGSVIEGKLSRFTPEGEDFQAFAGENVLDLISQATFGALSEGEREFLRQISFSLDKDEDVNVRDLKRYKQILQKALEVERGNLSNSAISAAEEKANAILGNQ